MGRKNKAYVKTLHQQAYDRLMQMMHTGESKKAAMAEGTMDDKIFSYNTYKTYWQHIKDFLTFVKKNHPECTTLRAAKKHVREWLQSREDENLSAWTVQVDAKAVNKLYGIKPGDKEYFDPPKRNRGDIKRSRGECVRDQHFSVTNNDELIRFCKGTGLRRSELENLLGEDLMTRGQIEAEISRIEALPKAKRTPRDEADLKMLLDTRMFKGEYFIRVRNGKGGRKRVSPIIGKIIQRIVERMEDTPPKDKVWQYVNSNADIHAYRAAATTAIYTAYARPIEDIPYDKVNKVTGRKYQSEVYSCRKDEAGKKLDKAAMLICSKALGHNRISVVADYYIRGL